MPDDIGFSIETTALQSWQSDRHLNLGGGGGGGGGLQDAMQVGNFMDNLSAVVQIATAKQTTRFMISFNSNPSLFRISFNFCQYLLFHCDFFIFT